MKGESSRPEIDRENCDVVAGIDHESTCGVRRLSFLEAMRGMRGSPRRALGGRLAIPRRALDAPAAVRNIIGVSDSFGKRLEHLALPWMSDAEENVNNPWSVVRLRLSRCEQ